MVLVGGIVVKQEVFPEVAEGAHLEVLGPVPLGPGDPGGMQTNFPDLSVYPEAQVCSPGVVDGGQGTQISRSGAKPGPHCACVAIPFGATVIAGPLPPLLGVKRIVEDGPEFLPPEFLPPF